MTPQKVRLFVKPYCPWCVKAMDWLDAHDVDYEVLDVIRDGKAYDEMERLSGQTLAPVIDVDGKILGDFGPPELAAFWRKLEQEPG
ncbi:MAG TPA: glutaredoxin [Roseimicrobium sp.]|nr:glutaredoxin [Roseimicrobium sp.]